MVERSKSGVESVGGDVVLPSQFFRNWRSERTLKSAECQLLVAVLADAIDCYQKHWGARDAAAQRLFREAENWIMEDTGQVVRAEVETGFSFQYVCEVLDIDPARVRSALRRWVDRHSKTEPVVHQQFDAHRAG